MPDGVYDVRRTRWRTTASATEPVKFQVTVTSTATSSTVDCTGTDPQVRGPINATYGVTAGAVYNALFHLTDPHIPKNPGAYRPIRIIAPAGLGGERRLPGPSVGGNTETHPQLATWSIAALAPALPDRVAAAEGGTSATSSSAASPEDRRLLRQLPPRGRRLGRRVRRRRQRRDHRQERQLPQHARRDLRDALSAAHRRVLADPRLRRRRRACAAASARDGSCASPRARRSRRTPCSTARSRASARGGSTAEGRADAADPRQRAGDDEFRTFSEAYGTASPSKFTNIRLKGGDEVLIDSPGGGGFGDPRERDRERVRATWTRASSPPPAARDQYG